MHTCLSVCLAVWLSGCLAVHRLSVGPLVGPRACLPAVAFAHAWVACTRGTGGLKSALVHRAGRDDSDETGMLEAWLSGQHIRFERDGVVQQSRVDMLIGGWMGGWVPRVNDGLSGIEVGLSIVDGPLIGCAWQGSWIACLEQRLGGVA
jgi:hypothetical protein